MHAMLFLPAMGPGLRRRRPQRIRPEATGGFETMATRRVATVFGGSGFIGRYVGQPLAQQGHGVRIAGRNTQGARLLKPMGAVAQIVPLFTSITNEGTVKRAVEG